MKFGRCDIELETKTSHRRQALFVDLTSFPLSQQNRRPCLIVAAESCVDY